MTALVNKLTTSSLGETGPGNILNVIVILIVLCIMVIQELARLRGDYRARGLIQTLDTAVYPLLAVFGMVIVLRLGLIIVLNVQPGAVTTP